MPRLKPIRVVVADDESLGRERIRNFLHSEPGVEFVGEAVDGDDAIAKVRELRPNLLFLDVQMPGKNGFEALAVLGSERPPAIIFVTAHDQFATGAFEVDAVDYLMKPFDRARFQVALERAVKRLEGNVLQNAKAVDLSSLGDVGLERLADRIPVKTGGRVVFVELTAIDWIGSADNYVELHTGQQTHLVRGTLTTMEQKLPGHRFVRISRTAIVNIDSIKELSSLFHGEYSILLRDSKKVILTRNYRHQLPKLGLSQPSPAKRLRAF